MSQTKASVLRATDKARAALGAAGLSAVGFAALASPLLIAVPGALLAALAAGYLTEISEKEESFRSASEKESVMSDASDI